MTSKLVPERLLSHPIRQALHERIQDRPGSTFLELLWQLRAHPVWGPSVGGGNLDYHLYCLQRFGFITSRKTGRARRYYIDAVLPPRHIDALCLLQTEPIPALAKLVLGQPGLCQDEIWHQTRRSWPCSRQAVSYHLVRMTRHDLISVTPGTVHGRPCKRYHPAPLLPALLRFLDGLKHESLATADPAQAAASASEVPA